MSRPRLVLGLGARRAAGRRPGFKDVEQAFINRRVEDEIRSEMDRDAALLKAKAKLEERSKNSTWRGGIVPPSLGWVRGLLSASP